ncbi:HNH endonuclease signature motif containing protein [Gottfriedia acidiceleris]
MCDINLPELLRASHSKPWKDSNNSERLDQYNGVLICCNHDALYDKGLIAFDGKGSLHISSKICEEYYLTYGLNKRVIIQIHSENKEYFIWHKNLFTKDTFYMRKVWPVFITESVNADLPNIYDVDMAHRNYLYKNISK